MSEIDEDYFAVYNRTIKAVIYVEHENSV